MTRIDAFIALFGDDPNLASHEAVTVLLLNRVLTEEDLDTLPDNVINRYEAFDRDEDLYIDSLEDEALKVLLRELITNEDDVQIEDLELIDDTIDMPELPDVPMIAVQIPIPKVNPVSTKPTAVDLDNLETVLNTAKPTGKPRIIDGGGNENSVAVTATPLVKQPIVLLTRPPVTNNLSIPAWVRLLHTNPYWHRVRKNIENAHNKSTSSDPLVQAEGLLLLQAWKQSADEYRRGCSGPERIQCGEEMLKLIDDLKDGADPTSDNYLTYYIDP